MPDKSESSRESAEGVDFARELERALEDEQFFLVYQPEIDLHSNAFVGVEALIRWRHPRRGVLSPDAFVPELESSGLILAVGRWALATACAQGAEWHDKGFRFTVSVNISALQFAWSGFVKEVEEVIATSRFPAGLLVLEFSQGTLSGDVSDRLVGLTQLGVRLAIDDFEPGQSLLSDVENLPIRVLKLDRHFVATLSDSPEGTSSCTLSWTSPRRASSKSWRPGSKTPSSDIVFSWKRSGLVRASYFPSLMRQRKLIGT